jgi:hypothetical protein
MEQIFKESVLSSFESKIKKHHELYPNLEVKDVYWESIVADSFGVTDWKAHNHNPNGDLKIRINGLIEPSLKSGKIENNILKFSSHRMSKFTELDEMLNFLDTRTYDSYLFLARPESGDLNYSVCYMPSKTWKYSELRWNPTFSQKGKKKGKQSGWYGVSNDGKIKCKIVFSMSSQLWVDVDMSLITLVKEIFI